MKLYYVANTARTKEILHAWHALELGNDQHLICIHWRDEGAEMEWANKDGVTRLPHPIFQSAVQIPEEFLSIIRGRFDLPEGATVHHVIQAASKHDAWMRLHVL